MIPRIKNAKFKPLSKWKFFVMKRFLPFYMFWILHIDRNKAKKFLLTRKEADHPKCTECGLCCRGCPAYNKETELCDIWEDADYRCRTGPICPLQLKVYGIQDFCKYYWGNDKLKKEKQ